MKSSLLFFSLLLPWSLAQTPVDPPAPTPQYLLPRVESDPGTEVIRFWKSLQDGTNEIYKDFPKDREHEKKLPYDVDGCYGWIGKERPKIGEYIGLALTPNCFIVKEDLLTFFDTFLQATSEYDRLSEDVYHDRRRCRHHHLFISRLHRLDEGGLFSYHYTRVRMLGNKLEVTFLALKDVLELGNSYQASASIYDHPSIKFFTADEFPTTFKPFVVYTIDFEVNVWFKSNEGLRLYNYRLTWDSGSEDNGYHIDVYSQLVIPNVIIPSDRVSYITTSEAQVHYFFVQTQTDNEYNVYLLKHTDFMKNDFSRLEIVETKMPVDVYPRTIVGKVLPYYSLAMYSKSIRFNKLCSFASHVEFYKNQSAKDGRIVVEIPEITDPPLALNIFATHYRSAYPFVQNGRKMLKPDYWSLVYVVIYVMTAMLFSTIVVLGYNMLPILLTRQLTLWLSVKRKYLFKELAHRRDSQYVPVYRVLHRLEKLIRRGLRRMVKTIVWFGSLDSADDDEECRQHLIAGGQEQVSTKEASTPND